MWLSGSHPRNSRLAMTTRVIGAVLLAAITWGSTFEFTHHHGVGSPTLAQRVATETQTNGNAESATRQLPPLSSRTSTSECAICQLHHNLATTLISTPAYAKCDVAQTAIAIDTVAVLASEFTSTRHGRAPPSLL